MGVEWVEPADQAARSVERELQTLAEALGSLLARDGEDPPVWASAAFVRRVAAARSVIASVAEPERLASGLEQTRRWRASGSTRFAMDARRLAGDAVAIAIAIRWMELRERADLPTWPELLRRRSLAPRRIETAPQPGHWFG